MGKKKDDLLYKIYDTSTYTRVYDFPQKKEGKEGGYEANNLYGQIQVSQA